MKKILSLVLAVLCVAAIGTTSLAAPAATTDTATFVFEDSNIYKFSKNERDRRIDGVFGPFRIETSDIGSTTAYLERNITYTGQGSFGINGVNMAEAFNITLNMNPNIPKECTITLMVYVPVESKIHDIQLAYFDTTWTHSAALSDEPTKVDWEAEKKGQWQKMEFKPTATQEDILFFIISVFGPEPMSGPLLYIDDIKIVDKNGNMVPCSETIIPPVEGAVTGITIDNSSVSLKAGDTKQLTATILPNDAANKNVTWTCTDESVCTVDQNGLVTALKNGNATVTVTSEDGGFAASCEIKVITPVTAVTLSDKTLKLKEGERFKLTAAIEPSDASIKQVTYSSDNEEVAKVASTGQVIANKKGTAVITVTTEDGKLTDTCVVTVVAESNSLIYILIGAAALLLIVVAIVLIVLAKKKKSRII